MIRPDTVLATTVHPLQVVDEPLPGTIHDFRVDLIVTPDEVIWCAKPPGHQASSGSIWTKARSPKFQCWPPWQPGVETPRQSAERSLSLQLSLLTSRPALRAASGRPPARQRHDGHRGAGPTLSVAGTKHSPPAHQREGVDQLTPSTTSDQRMSVARHAFDVTCAFDQALERISSSWPLWSAAIKVSHDKVRSTPGYLTQSSTSAPGS